MEMNMDIYVQRLAIFLACAAVLVLILAIPQ